jgi:hypothetical protein
MDERDSSVRGCCQFRGALMIRAIMAFSLLLLLAVPARAILFGGASSGGGGGGGTEIALTRTFNNPSSAATTSNQFWMIGQPFISGPTEASAGIVSQNPDVPSGDIFTAALGGQSVRVAACQRKSDSDGSLAWAQVLVDLTGADISGSGGSAMLQLTSTSGSWSSSTNASDSDWEALEDEVVIGSSTYGSSITTTSSSNGDMNSGPYTATFNSSATITAICNSPLGREVQVAAPFVNSSGDTHCYLQAVMWYWVTQNSSGGHGVANSPIASLGPLIENEQVFKNGSNGCDSGDEPGIFTYGAAFIRNGTVIRGGSTSAYNNIVHLGQTGAWMGRADGQWDWDCGTTSSLLMNGSCAPIYADEDGGGLYVTQDYTKVNATYKIPALVHGITYDGGACEAYPTAPITGVSGATFTASGGIGGLTQMDGDCGIQNQYNPPTAIEFTGSLSGLSGISLGTTYWLSFVSGDLTESGSFKIYDNEADAYAAGSTGLITPGGTYSGSGLTAQLDAGPENIGLGYLSMPDTGNREDLSLWSSWGAGYLVIEAADAAAMQRLARVMGFAMTAIPEFTIDSGAIPSLLDTAGTPSSLPNMGGGTGMVNDEQLYSLCGIDYSSDINGGNGPTPTSGGSGLSAQCGLWSVNPEHFPGSSVFPVWLMEGNPALQQIGVGLGNALWSMNSPLWRNFTLNSTTYVGAPQYDLNNERGIAWTERNVGEAAFMATGGSAEETYFRNQLADAATYLGGLDSYMGANATALGLDFVNEDLPVGSVADSNLGIGQSNFMNSYVALAFGEAALLNGNSASGWNTAANNVLREKLDMWNNFCPYFGDIYNPIPQASDYLSATPGTFVTPAELGFGESTTFSFSGSTVTASNAGWVPGPQSSGSTVPFAENDLVHFQNLNSDNEGPINTAPSPAVDGTIYYVHDPSGANFEISTEPNGGGTILSGFTSTSDVGGVMTPGGGETCPSTDTIYSNVTEPTASYLVWIMAGLAVGAERGVDFTSASLGTAANAYSEASARFTGSFNTDPTWAFQGSP